MKPRSNPLLDGSLGNAGAPKPKPAPVRRQADLFSAHEELETMVRHPDSLTSIEAAEANLPTAGKNRRRVWDALGENGELTDDELEALEELADLGESTGGKRRGELVEMGLVEWTGERRIPRSSRNANAGRTRQKVWRVVPGIEWPGKGWPPKKVEAPRRG